MGETMFHYYIIPVPIVLFSVTNTLYIHHILLHDFFTALGKILRGYLKIVLVLWHRH